MDLDELAVDYYHKSLALAQKSLIAGLTVSGVAYLVAITGEPQSSYTIPLIGVEVTSLSSFSITLLILFVVCGAAYAYGINKALDNLRLISDTELSFRLLQVPSLFMSGVIIYSLLYGFVFMIGVSLSGIIFGVSGWVASALGSAVAVPYFVAFRISSGFRQLSNEQVKP